jgi:hypothetical protein
MTPLVPNSQRIDLAWLEFCDTESGTHGSFSRQKYRTQLANRSLNLPRARGLRQDRSSRFAMDGSQSTGLQTERQTADCCGTSNKSYGLGSATPHIIELRSLAPHA